MRYVPLIFDQGRCFRDPVDGLNGCAAKLQEMQTSEAFVADSMAFGNLSHVLVDRDEDCIISLGNFSHEDVR